MHEGVGKVELTQLRAGGVVEDLKQMFNKGLPSQAIRDARRDEPELHQDMLRVQLGLKAAAAYLLPVFEHYTLPDGRFAPTSIEKPHVDGVVYDSEYGAMWRPDLVRQVIEDPQNAELVEKSFSANPALEEAIQEGYDSPIISAVLATLTEGHDTPEQLALAGLLYGFPRAAVLEYAKWDFAIRNIPDMLWREATGLGYAPKIAVPTDIKDISANTNGVRDEFVRLLKLVIPEAQLTSYLESMRVAEIPGWPFITSGDTTREAEAEIIASYKNSSIEQKLDALLA